MLQKNYIPKLAVGQVPCQSGDFFVAKKLGKRDYKRYIGSKEWSCVKEKYKKDYCQICGNKYCLNLHHLTYLNLGNENETDVATLCSHCHLAFHINQVSTKKLKEPSRGLARFYRSIISNGGSTMTMCADFLRRRYIVQYGDKNLPPHRYFRGIVRKKRRGEEKNKKSKYFIDNNFNFYFEMYQSQTAKHS